MGFDEPNAIPADPLATEVLAANDPSIADLDLVSHSLDNLNFVDRNISELKRELSSLDKEELFDTNRPKADNDRTHADKGLGGPEGANGRDPRDERGCGTFARKHLQEHAPEHFKYGLEGVFDAMKSHYPEKSPFLATGRLDTESLRQKLLQENMDEDSIFYDRALLNSNYGKPPSFKTSLLPKLAPETFFYVFYNVTKDTLQHMAANELFKREWRYHESNKLWFKHDEKKSTWTYFDPASWSTRTLNLTPEVENSLMSRQEFESLLEGQG